MTNQNTQFAARILSAAAATTLVAVLPSQLLGTSIQWGNDVFLGNSASGVINDQNDIRSQRFQAPYNIDVNRVHLGTNGAGGVGATGVVSIQADNGSGSPSGIDLATGSIAMSATQGYTIDLDSTLSLTAGQSYHLTLRSPNANATNTILWRINGATASPSTVNVINPTGTPTFNYAQGGSSNNGSTWSFSSIQTTPWALSNSTTGQIIGQPYNGVQVTGFGSTTWAGQRLKYTGGTGALSGLSLQLRGLGGSLGDDLRVHLVDVASQGVGTNSLPTVTPGSELFSGVLVPNGTTPAVSPGTFYNLTIPEADRPTLTNGQSYMLLVETATAGVMQISFAQASNLGIGVAATEGNFEGMNDGFVVISNPLDPMGENGMPSVFYSNDLISTNTFARDARFSLNVVVPDASVWNVDADGDWSVAGNWSGGAPNAIGAVANFGTIITSTHTVTVDAPQTVGQINFSSPVAYTVSGSSTITLDGGTGATAINVTAGSHIIDAPIVLAKDTAVSIAGGGALSARHVRGAGLSVSGGAMKITAKGTANDPTGTSVVTALSIGTGASLDLTNNSMVIDYNTVGTLVDDTRQMLAAGKLTSSATGGKLGYADNAVLHLTSFAGQTVDDGNLLVKFTYGGDANLDGQVDISDLGALATAWQTSAPWTGGDFDYSGFVDISDLGILATNWQLGVGAPLGPSFDEALASVGLAGVSVPEPTSLMVLGLTGLLGLNRKRRRNG